MGFFLSSLQNQLSVFQMKIKEWAQSLQKVRDYHGVFKSVCDTFVIRREQFSQIFGSEQKLVLWQGNTTINALQVFCGLGFYSSCSGFRLKLKFLFALFDFNEIKSISVVDLEYMILSILNFTYRMLGRTNSRADQLRLAQWLMRFVNPHKRMNINSLARFCEQSQDARQFLKLTGNITEVSDKKENEVYDRQKQMEQSEKIALLNERKAVQIHNKLVWFSNFTQKLTKPKYKKQMISTSNISWVYGIDLFHFRTPFIVLADGRILYSISTKLIIYCPKAKSQIIYSRHIKRIQSFAIYQPAFIIASSQGEDSPRVHVWDYRTLQTLYVINIDHSHKVQLLAFSPLGTLITVGSRQQSPLSLFDSKDCFKLKASFAVSDYIYILTPFSTPLQMGNLNSQLTDIFVLAGKRSVTVVNSKYNQYRTKYQSNITSLAVSYMSIQQPFLRYFTCNTLRLFIVTSHQSGNIMISIFDPHTLAFQTERYQLLKFEQAPKQVILTSQAFFIILNNEVRVYDLNIFTIHEDKFMESPYQPRIIRPSDVQNLILLSQQLLFAGVNTNSIFLITVQGDFLEVGDREIGFNNCLQQQQSIKRLDEFVRLGGKLKALCLAQKQNRGTLMIVSQNTKIFQIDPYSHKVTLMMQIKYQSKAGKQQVFQQPITVIDYGIAQQGPAYIVCGSQTGKLLIKTDQEQIAKIYDCQSEITDLKISKDASYLLVATLNSLMFFQLLPSLSSPRKITFQHQSPVTLNFLDNPRICSVGTSAKNIYLIQVPQLRHRNVQKDNQCFSVTKMVVDYPHRLQTPSSKVNYSRCYIGGDMKFYLITLTTGQILYFPSMSSLPHKNYLLMRAHQSSISNVVVSEDQSLFYTVGESDSMLVEWSVKQQKPTFVIKQIHDQKNESLHVPQKRLQVFDRMKMASEITNNREDNVQLCTFFFRGTKSNKLNRKLHQLLRFNTQNLGEEQLSLMKRHCRAYLKINSVYGMQSNKIGQVCYLLDRADDNRILYTVSRFIIQTQGEGSIGQRIYQTANNIAYFSLSQLGEPIYAQSGRCPRIFVSGAQAVKTLHKNGLIHFSIYGDFILSLGIQNQCYSINLHNYRTGQLISQRTTYYKITSFLMTSPNDFISLPEIKIWHGLIASQTIGIASSGAVLPGNKDICLGGRQGQLSILSQNGLFIIATNAHNKQIVTIKINQVSPFQVITASLDQTIKIWNQYFQLLNTINLAVPGEFKMLREVQTFGIDTVIRSQAFAVRSLDCKSNRILAVMAIGQIWEYQITSHQEKVHQSQDPSSSANIESDSNQDEQIQTPKKSQIVHLNYQIERRRLLNANCSQTAQSFQRYITFDIHPQFALLASAGSDGRVIFRNYLTEQVVGNYICERDEQIKVRAVRFSPKGRMFVIGITSAIVMTFFMDLIFDNLKKIKNLQLHHFQTFKLQQKIYQIMTLQFSDNSEMFAVSYFQQTNTKRQRNGQSQQSTSLIRIFKAKQEKNQNQNEAYYQLKQQIKLKEEESSTKNSRCAVKLQFDTQNKTYLFITQQYFDNLGLRLFSVKGKYSLYCIQDRMFLSDQYSINWQRFSFPGLINLRYHDPKTDQTHDNYIITAMIRYKDILIYGGNDGRIHILKLESLDIAEEVNQYRTNDMCLSRVYSALTSPITELKIGQADNRIFLFVSGFGDQSIVKFQLIEQSSAYFLQHQPYPLLVQDPMKEYLNKEHFYLTINTRQPLRQELSNILQDVESDIKNEGHLQFVKSFGRRAIDRRYNLTYFDENILYSLGPNLVVQNVLSGIQYLLKADPSPYSHCPQISAFSYNSNFLIIATQQQRSNIYVWDIKSKSCITSMQIQCSFVLNIQFIPQNCAVYYGINDKYEPVISLIDWRKKTILGSMRLPFTGLSAVRDITPIHFKGNNQFVTCGYLHLCLWEIRGDTLVYHNFNSQSNARYLSIKQFNNYIITGCEEGHLYLWHQFQLIHILHNTHQASVTCLEVDINNEIIISGGKDGLLVFLKIEESRLAPFNRVQLNKIQSNQSFSQVDTFEIQLQIQSISPNPNLLSDDYQTLLVGTRSGSIYQIKYSQCQDNSSLLYQHHDNQTIVSVCFSSYDSQSFFTLTNAGLVQRYNITTLSCTMKFDLGQPALKIQSCGDYLLICCRQELLAYRIIIGQSRLQRTHSFSIDTRKIQEQNKEMQIIRFCLSKTQKILAICLKNCSKQPTYQINIYNLNSECLHQLTNLKHQIDYLDFSVDDKYLLFKDRYEEIGMISLEKQFRRINTIFVEMGIQWQQQALRLSPNAQSIYYSYSCENKITAITRLGKNKIIVGDQMGTVRIFDYPCPDDRLGELHLHCYCVHMNDIAEIVVHPELSYVLSVGLQDRSLVLWRVNKG